MSSDFRTDFREYTITFNSAHRDKFRAANKFIIKTRELIEEEGELDASNTWAAQDDPLIKLVQATKDKGDDLVGELLDSILPVHIERQLSQASVDTDEEDHLYWEVESARLDRAQALYDYAIVHGCECRVWPGGFIQTSMTAGMDLPENLKAVISAIRDETRDDCMEAILNA